MLIMLCLLGFQGIYITILVGLLRSLAAGLPNLAGLDLQILVDLDLRSLVGLDLPILAVVLHILPVAELLEFS